MLWLFPTSKLSLGVAQRVAGTRPAMTVSGTIPFMLY
jgi:hypothetical protein